MKLTEQQIRYGYWYYRPEKSFPPEEKLISEYNGEKCLTLCLTKGNEAYREIKKREKSYQSEIPIKLKKLEILWIDHCNQDTFNAICKLSKLKSLYINSNSIKDLSLLSNLENLKHLGLLNMTKVESIKSISFLKRLQTLKLEHFKKITDFTPLAELKKLEGLEIDGGTYTTQLINDFNFLYPLNQLKYLTLINSRAKNKNFDPISKLSNLKMLKISTNFPVKEFQKLREIKQLKYIEENIRSLIHDI